MFRQAQSLEQMQSRGRDAGGAPNQMSFESDVRGRFANLSPALRQVARYVLDHPNEVVTTSMRTLGTRAGSTPATLVRFAQHVGYSGWPELKSVLTGEMGLGAETYGRRAKKLVRRAKDRTLTAEMFEVQRRNLEITQGQIEASLEPACALLEGAGAVHIAGFRACFAIALAFVYVYRIFRDSVHLVDGQGGTLEMQQRAFAKGDVVVVVSFAPYSREPIAIAEKARAAGARVLAITDSLASPISLLAEKTLLFSILSPSFFPSIAAGIALVEALLELLASRAGKSIIKRIDDVEASLFASGAYLSP